MTITVWKDLNPTQNLALKQLGGERPIVVRPSVVRALRGDGSAAILLSKMIWWSQTDAAAEDEGWFYLTTQSVTNSLGLSSDVQQRVRDSLVRLGVLETDKRGNKNYYRIHLDRIVDLVADTYYVDTSRTGGKSGKGMGGKSGKVGGESSPTNAGNPPLVSGESPHTYEENPPYKEEREETEETRKEERRLINPGVRVNTRDDLPSPQGIPSTPPAHAYGQAGIDRAVEIITATYPVGKSGVGVTKKQATEIVWQLGGITAHASEEERDAARERVKTFIRAVRNFRQAIEDGDWGADFVYGFGKFSGLTLKPNEEPEYLRWVNRVPKVKKRTLVV